jgi:hypothetical protein
MLVARLVDFEGAPAVRFGVLSAEASDLALSPMPVVNSSLRIRSRTLRDGRAIESSCSVVAVLQSAPPSSSY